VNDAFIILIFSFPFVKSVWVLFFFLFFFFFSFSSSFPSYFSSFSSSSFSSSFLLFLLFLFFFFFFFSSSSSFSSSSCSSSTFFLFLFLFFFFSFFSSSSSSSSRLFTGVSDPLLSIVPLLCARLIICRLLWALSFFWLSYMYYPIHSKPTHFRDIPRPSMANC